MEYFPSYSLEMNSLENCWRSSRMVNPTGCFQPLTKVKAYLSTALPTLNSPRIYEYLC